MRRLLSIATAVVIFSSAPASADQKSEFMAAFRAYKAAVEAQDRTAARNAARTAYETGKVLFGPDHKNTAALALNYGRLLEDEEAENMLHEALQLHERVYGSGALELVDPLMDLAAEHTRYNRLGNAKRYYWRALDIAKDKKGEDDRLVGVINLEIGQVALGELQSAEAYKYLKRSEDIFEKLEGNEAELLLAETRFWIGKYKLAVQSEKAATDAFLASLSTFERIKPDAPLTMTLHAFLVEAYERRGLRDAATEHCRAIGKANPISPDQDYLPVFRRPPKYPPQAGEGSVVISLTVDEDGFVRNPTVLENEGSERFIRAALEAAESFRYVPRFEGGKAVATTDVKYRFTFEYAD